MKIEIKAYNLLFEDWGDEVDDFFLSCQVDIGFVGEVGSEIYSFDVISPKRLDKVLNNTKIEIGKGYFIMSDYNKNIIIQAIESIANGNDTSDRMKVFNNIRQYFRSQD